MTIRSNVCSTMWCSSVEIALGSERVGAGASPARAVEVFLLQNCYSRVLWTTSGSSRGTASTLLQHLFQVSTSQDESSSCAPKTPCSAISMGEKNHEIRFETRSPNQKHYGKHDEGLFLLLLPDLQEVAETWLAAIAREVSESSLPRDGGAQTLSSCQTYALLQYKSPDSFERF